VRADRERERESCPVGEISFLCVSARANEEDEQARQSEAGPGAGRGRRERSSSRERKKLPSSLLCATSAWGKRKGAAVVLHFCRLWLAARQGGRPAGTLLTSPQRGHYWTRGRGRKKGSTQMHKRRNLPFEGKISISPPSSSFSLVVSSDRASVKRKTRKEQKVTCVHKYTHSLTHALTHSLSRRHAL